MNSSRSLPSPADPNAAPLAAALGGRGEIKRRFQRGTIAAIFEAQARETPDKAAIILGEDSITYSQLNERANQIAHYLRAAGFGVESKAALYMDRTFEAIASLLGVLKAGGAYVPIDPSYPRDRVAFILEDAAVDLALTQPSLADGLSGWNGRKVVARENQAEWGSFPGENPSGMAGPDNAAYVIYTSGSTGKPKGVVVTHHNVVRLFGATDDYFGFNENDVWTLFHSFAFDLSVWEMWGAFFYGGKLAVAPYLTSRSPQEFHRLLVRRGVTVLTQTPSAFRQLIWADESEAASVSLALRHVVLAGEALDLQMLRPWFQRHSDERPAIINMYGITETTVHVTHRQIRQQDVEQGKGSLIGPPMSDLVLRILDENQKPCPPEAPGEIYVGGPGVARGYLNRPELNAQRFVADPCDPDSGVRFYRSGDLARRLPGGEIEFLGRMDDQVKIRGFRVELGEIQAALNKHPRVRANLIIPEKQADQTTRLLAYFVPANGSIAVDELREFLSQTLPDYMIPAVFLPLEKIPLTLNGKVDRRALPTPGPDRPELKARYAPPSTPAERLLAEIWRKVLGVATVGVHDNYFALGGDSIRSIEVLAEARRGGLALSLATLFEKPTIYELAGAAESVADTPAGIRRAPFRLVAKEDAARLPAGLADAYPMSKLQAGMVFHSERTRSSAIFHDVFTYRANLPYREEKFERAAQELAAQHAIFRTAYDLSSFSEPMQLVRTEARVPVSTEDLSGLAAREQRARALAWIEREKRTPFDWQRPPFMRLHVLILAPDSFQLGVSFHHSIMDGWSLAEMSAELLRQYKALLEGQPRPLAAPQARYSDFIELERRALGSDESRRFWEEQLNEMPAGKLPRWPASRRAGGLEQTRGPEVRIRREALARLKGLASELGVPLKSVLLAAHCRVISLLSGQDEIATALISNGRPETSDGQRLIGLFLNAAPFRAALEPEDWKSLIRKTFRREREMLPHRRCPLAALTAMSRGLKLESAFDFVQFHNLMGAPGFSEGKLVEGEYFEANDFPFYTTFMLEPDGTGLSLHIDYDPNEFCAEQIQLISEYYFNCVEAIARNPSELWFERALLPKSETDRLLVEWNRTFAPVPNCCVHHLFEEQAARAPHRIAAIFEGCRITYGELNARAERLAARLRQLGAGPETVVGICLERSLEMLVALIAALKSGGAYLPLDPNFPEERVRYMTEDSGAPIVLTQNSRAQWFQSPRLRAVCLDGDGSSGLEPAATGRAFAQPTGASLAYLIYTSGSTGRPKGVEITHRAVVNFLQDMRGRLAIGAEDRWLAVTTLSFDIAALELFLPLAAGAAVVIAPADVPQQPELLSGALDQHRISILQATPALWRSLIDSGWSGRRELAAICGGEKLDVALGRRLAQLCGRVWNMYGPTETTIWSAAHALRSGEAIASADDLPIGRPIENTEIYVLDKRWQLAPTGARGEIFIGGAGLAREYHNNEALTRENFVPHPWKRGQRLYRTGDLGARLPDGNLIIGGRVDHQVKLRGHRIELEEIESVLQQHPAVSAAAARLVRAPHGDPALAAYWRARPGRTASEAELNRFLESKLPNYMVPSRLARVEAFALTPNGKIDRRRLPDLGKPSDLQSAAAQREATPLESQIRQVWAEVLKLEEIGLSDDFFKLGGDSLRAAQVISKLRKQTRSTLSFAALFKYPTVQSFAEFLTNSYEK